MKLIIVTGLSGSGKSIALHTFEDLGYYCVDNLPILLLEPFASQISRKDVGPYQDAVVGIDARNDLQALSDFPKVMEQLGAIGLECQIVFLQAEPETLLKRFSETRRKHPLTRKDLSLGEAIRMERQLLEPISSNADIHIDTTQMTLHQLRDLLRDWAQGDQSTLSILFQSFGFKHGITSDADFVFDIRCLPNPHWNPQLRPFTGKDPEVRQFLEQHDSVHEMYHDLVGFLERWVPLFEANNRSYMTVSIGCTGGQHRSVYLAERLAQHFQKKGKNVIVRHRELS